MLNKIEEQWNKMEERMKDFNRNLGFIKKVI